MSRVSFQVTSGRGRSFVAWIRAARWAGWCRTPPQEGGHGSQLRHLGGVIRRGHVIDGLPPAAGQAGVGLEKEGGTEAASHSRVNTGAISRGPGRS